MRESGTVSDLAMPGDTHYGGVFFVCCTSGQYAGCESRRILKIYRVWVNTIPSGNKPAAHYEWQQMPGPYDQSSVLVAGLSCFRKSYNGQLVLREDSANGRFTRGLGASATKRGEAKDCSRTMNFREKDCY